MKWISSEGIKYIYIFVKDWITLNILNVINNNYVVPNVMNNLKLW